MRYYSDSDSAIAEMTGSGRNSCEVLTAENGCVAGCRAGFTIYELTEYGNGGVHQDQRKREGVGVPDGLPDV